MVDDIAANIRVECLRMAATHAISCGMSTEQWLDSASRLAEFALTGKRLVEPTKVTDGAETVPTA